MPEIVFKTSTNLFVLSPSSGPQQIQIFGPAVHRFSIAFLTLIS